MSKLRFVPRTDKLKTGYSLLGNVLYCRVLVLFKICSHAVEYCGVLQKIMPCESKSQKMSKIVGVGKILQ